MTEGKQLLLRALLIGMLILLYFLWAGRSFYVKPQKLDGDVAGIPEEILQTVRNWNQKQMLFGPPQFSWEQYLWCLRHPLESGPVPITLFMNGGYHIIMHPGMDAHPELSFLEIVEDWENGHKITVKHKHRGTLPIAQIEAEL